MNFTSNNVFWKKCTYRVDSEPITPFKFYNKYWMVRVELK